MLMENPPSIDVVSLKSYMFSHPMRLRMANKVPLLVIRKLRGVFPTFFPEFSSNDAKMCTREILYVEK